MNKKIIYALSFFTYSLIINSCQEPFIAFNPNVSVTETIEPADTELDTITNINDIFVPEEITTDTSIEDPQQTGIPCVDNNRHSNGPFTGNDETLIDIEIPIDLPIHYDLSENMPPVRTQGQQGSCTAWATTYYLKSYQEKTQYGYEYKSYENVMSPSFVYNQIKVNSDCDSGSYIVDALELLKTQGASTWLNFPYSDKTCYNIPSEEIIATAFNNKIKDYYSIQTIDANETTNDKSINIIKTFITQDNPVVIAIDIFNMFFYFKDSNYITQSYFEMDTDACPHAVLIVGYDDELSAFKIINSWGTSWGNDGYAWVHYHFFLPNEDVDRQRGLMEAYVTFDMKKEEIDNEI